MGIRFQQHDIEIPEDDFFRFDRLGRKASIELLTKMVRNVDGPATIAVDAAWGAGKTTFLRLWAKYLKDQGFAVIDYNAWQTDYADDPFIALAAELTDALAAMPNRGVALLLRKLKHSIGGVAQAKARPTFRTIASVAPVVGQQLAYELSPSSHTPLQATIHRYREVTAARERFRSHLADVASLVNDQSSLPLVVMIDELDRCRPHYAIELLETAKHLFNVDGIVFVLCIDRGQLESSVQAIYGEQFDSQRYLERFFDLHYRLPLPNRQEFAEELLAKSGIAELLRPHRDAFGFPPDQRDLAVAAIVNRPVLSVRQLLQLVDRLAAGLTASSTLNHFSPYLLTVLCAFRCIDPKLYRVLLSGGLSDEKAIEAFVQGHERFAQHWRVYMAIESVLIAIVCLSSADNGRQLNHEMVPRLRHYEDQIAKRGDSRQYQTRPERIVQFVKAACGFSVVGPHDGMEDVEVSDQMGMQGAVALVEMFPEDEPITGLE